MNTYLTLISNDRRFVSASRPKIWQKQSFELSIESFDVFVEALQLSDRESEMNQSLTGRGKAVIGDHFRHDLSGHRKHVLHVTDGF